MSDPAVMRNPTTDELLELYALQRMVQLTRARHDARAADLQAEHEDPEVALSTLADDDRKTLQLMRIAVTSATTKLALFDAELREACEVPPWAKLDTLGHWVTSEGKAVVNGQ